jgi:hypothetical protein
MSDYSNEPGKGDTVSIETVLLAKAGVISQKNQKFGEIFWQRIAK